MFSFYLMSEKGYQVLKALVESPFIAYIDQVISSRDAGVQKDFYNEIKDLCAQNKIIFIDKSKIASNSSQYSFAISWRWLINAPNLIVLHDSLLPRYRGFSPLVMALINGDKEIGVTALFANAEFDRGDIIQQKSISISYPIKVNEAIKAIASLYTDVVLDIVKALVVSNTITTSKQDDSLATYSLWRDENDYAIEWHKDSQEIERFINATGFPYKGASTNVNGDTARILDVEQVDDVLVENRTPGKVIFIDGNYPIVVCGSGLLKIKQMAWDDGRDALPLKKFRTRFI